MTQQSPSQSDKNAHLAITQGDLAVNLFIILLIILSALTLAQVSTSTDGYLAPFNSNASTDTDGAPAKSWQAILPIYPKVVVRGDTAYMVDLRKLAEAFAKDMTMELGPDSRDTSRMLPGDPDPTAHTVFVRLYDQDAFPQDLTAQAVPLTELLDVTPQNAAPDATAFWQRLEDTPKIDLILYPDDLSGLTPLMDSFHRRNIAVRLVLMSQQDIFGFSHRGADFGLERSFK